MEPGEPVPAGRALVTVHRNRSNGLLGNGNTTKKNEANDVFSAINPAGCRLNVKTKDASLEIARFRDLLWKGSAGVGLRDRDIVSVNTTTRV